MSGLRWGEQFGFRHSRLKWTGELAVDRGARMDYKGHMQRRRREGFVFDEKRTQFSIDTGKADRWPIFSSAHVLQREVNDHRKAEIDGLTRATCFRAVR